MLPRQRYILIVCRLMLVMVVFFIAFRWIHLSTPLIRLFLLVLILLLMPTLNFLPVWFALSLLRFRLPSRLPMMNAMRQAHADRKSGSAGMPRPTWSILFPYTTLFRSRLMLVMVVFFIAFRWIHLSTPLIRLFLLVLILLLMPTLNFLPVWFALSLLRFRLPSRLPMMNAMRQAH